MEKKLTRMKEGEGGKIVRIEEFHGPYRMGMGHGSRRGRGHGRRRDLRTMGVREGKMVEIQSKQPMGGPIVIKIDNMTITLGRGMARKILVEVQ